MDLKDAEEFLASAISYCKLVENYLSNNDKDKLTHLLISISSLYTLAMSLSEVEPDDTEVYDIKFDIPDVKLKRTILIG
jgi:hypothetical protein